MKSLPKIKDAVNTEINRRVLISSIRVLAGNDLPITNELSLLLAYLPTVIFEAGS